MKLRKESLALENWSWADPGGSWVDPGRSWEDPDPNPSPIWGSVDPASRDDRYGNTGFKIGIEDNRTDVIPLIIVVIKVNFRSGLCMIRLPCRTKT